MTDDSFVHKNGSNRASVLPFPHTGRTPARLGNHSSARESERFGSLALARGLPWAAAASAMSDQMMTPEEAQRRMEEAQNQQKAMVEDRKAVELAMQVANKAEKNAIAEVKELELAAKEFDEQLTGLKDRVAAVTSELSQLKLSTSLERALDSDQGAEQDPNLEITSFREIAPTVNKAFKHALTSRLGDAVFVEKLTDNSAASRPEFCRVQWQGESAEWKVHDPRDGTEVTFGALLQDVSRYWGMHHADMCFLDLAGDVCCLELNVWDELGPSGDCAVELARRPRTEQLDSLEYAYEEDESTLPIAVQRKLDRERRAKQLERHTKESIRKQAARERSAVLNQLVQYVLMMMLYFYVLNQRRDVRQAFLLTDAMRTAFVDENFGDFNEKTFEDIRTYEEFYMWATGPFTEGLLPAEYYDGEVIPAEKKRVMSYNRVVGGLRMRQVRVTPNEGCEIPSNVQEFFMPDRGPDMGVERIRKYVSQCYSNYAAGVTWSRRPFSVMDQNVSNTTGPVSCREYANGEYADPRDVVMYDKFQRCLGMVEWDTPKLVDPETGDTNVSDPLLLAFTWRDEFANSLPGYGFTGRSGSLYDGSGFVFDLTNLTTDGLVEAFEFLQENIWLDRQTRALFISLVVYNGNFNLYSVLNFRLELSLAGTITPTYKLETVKMDLFYSVMDTTDDLIRMVLEGLLYSGMVYYLFNEFRELYSVYSATGSILGYFQDFWNVIDWSLIFLSFLALAMRVIFVTSPSVRSFSPFAEEYVEITAEADRYNASFAFDAIAASFGIFKIFRFFDLQRNLLILRESITRGVGDLVSFTLMLMIIIVGFSLSFMNIFGQENDEYVNFIQSFVTLFLTVLGEFDFDKMLRVNQEFAYFFFLFYQIFVFLVMINIFLAILNDAYLAIKAKFDAEDVDEGPPPPTIRERIANFRAWVRQRKLDQRIEALRKQQRQRDMHDRRAMRKVEEARAKTLKGMGIDPAAQSKQQGGSRGDANSSAMLRTGEM